MLTATRSQATRRNSSYLRLLSLFPGLTWLLLGLPVLGGLLGVGLPAFGYFPELGENHFHLGHFRSLFAHPALPWAVGLTLWTGLASTAISLALALLLAAVGTLWASVVDWRQGGITWRGVFYSTALLDAHQRFGRRRPRA